MGTGRKNVKKDDIYIGSWQTPSTLGHEAKKILNKMIFVKSAA